VVYRDVYNKPIVFDEVNTRKHPQRWGDLSAEEMVHRFWQGTIAAHLWAWRNVQTSRGFI
jgi:hypothetical protein